MPAGFAAVEVKDFRDFVDKEKNSPAALPKAAPTKTGSEKSIKLPEGTPTLLKDVVPPDKDSLEARLRKSDVALYHLTLDDGKAVHLAWFLAAHDGEKIPANVDLFTKELTPGQSAQLDELKSWIDANIDKAQYTDPKNKVAMKLLEVLPIKATPAGTGQMWTTGARFLVTVDDMPFAFFGKGYFLNVGGHLTAGVLAGFDGERLFWDPVIDAAMTSLATGEKPAAE